MHLEQWYAQSHPDEDFAETFAVWLAPDSHWRERYAGWPVLRKLEYVVADAVHNGADTLVTHGGFQSNHCRATAAIGGHLVGQVAELTGATPEQILRATAAVVAGAFFGFEGGEDDAA